jgi:enamine deaminase RidA (YjgF/YER057c/UK114 family)
MIRTHSSQGIGYSVAQLHDVRHVFVSAVPKRGGSLEQQADDALRNVRDVICQHECHDAIVHQAVFVRDLNQVEKVRQIIKDFYGDQLPATSYIPQPPCEGKELSIEALGVGCANGDLQIQRVCEQMVITRHSGITWVNVANMLPSPTTAGVYNRSLVAFEKLSQMLSLANVRYDEVIRTWIYLGDIVGPEGETQRYKELNRARTDFYNHFDFCRRHLPGTWNGRPAYPASTGIGTEGKGVMLSGMALQTSRSDLVLLPLENPQQTAACDYGQEYGYRSPKFARALAVAAGDSGTIFVSGTASITDAESRFVGDVEGQTGLTLDNIEALISHDNLKRQGLPGHGATLQDLGIVRVYIKRKEDYQKVRAVCEARFGERPTIYAVADVCRPELLVEIEAIAFSCPPL